jgi:hypothetical protein
MINGNNLFYNISLSEQTILIADTRLAEGQCFSLPSHRFRVGIRGPLDVKGKDNSKPGYINKNMRKYNASYQVINEVSDTIMDWSNYEGHGGRKDSNTAPDFRCRLFTFFTTADLTRFEIRKEVFYFNFKYG